MSGDHKSIQLQQQIIHLKSELDKYKTLLASLTSEDQLAHLHEQTNQLMAENTELTEKCRQYEDMLSRQTTEIHDLSAMLEKMDQENGKLREEIEQLKTEHSYWKEQTKMKEEHIQSLLKEITDLKQKQTEWEKEREMIEEKKRSLERELSMQRSFMNEHVSFQSTLTLCKERIETMEKDYGILKEYNHQLSREVEELKNALVTHKPEADELKEEVRLLVNKLHTVEEKLSQMDQERHKDLLVLQKHILNQQVELESILEKTSRFSREIEHLSKQMENFTKKWDDREREDPDSNMSELKDMLRQIVQLLTIEHETSSRTIQSAKQLVGSKQTESSSSNSFLKLQEFIDETKQPIVVSPVRTKESHLTSSTHLSSQKSNQMKRVRMENHSSHHSRHPSRRHQSSAGEEEDRSPNSPASTIQSQDTLGTEARISEWINNNEHTLSIPSQTELPFDRASALESQDRTNTITHHDQSFKDMRGNHQKTESENEIHETLMLPAPITKNESTMQDVLSSPAAAPLSPTKATSETNLAHPSSSPMETDRMVQADNPSAEEEIKSHKWRLLSFFKKTKIVP
ncbi:hypothetical protein RA955_11420 [Geobacillus proteiniphilus]|uniref:Uncharacterized protein n=1 Tax=Geobacillus proteiniphilus TaxID=860353 RepID=A0A1Q5SZS8_9BACL|nr:hypothetical protein [Geobacillus proteiniphilus]OKO93528.1 hypothetical protein BRO54_1867 [Geobacillus proteiniphilus]WMJ15413.1 hypothetical protein RA955_11420 [Geobacillus proteiniphilus]